MIKSFFVSVPMESSSGDLPNEKLLLPNKLNPDDLSSTTASSCSTTATTSSSCLLANPLNTLPNENPPFLAASSVSVSSTVDKYSAFFVSLILGNDDVGGSQRLSPVLTLK